MDNVQTIRCWISRSINELLRVLVHRVKKLVFGDSGSGDEVAIKVPDKIAW